MARGEKLGDAIRYEKIDNLRQDLYSYIGNNSEKIDANLPVFFAHIVSALDNGFPDIDNATYDEFIDSIAYRLMTNSKQGNSTQYIERIIKTAIRSKRSSGKASLRILGGLQLLSSGHFQDAITYFADYWKHDARIGFYIAYCYYSASKSRIGAENSESSRNKQETELAAREQLLEMIRVRPPLYRLKPLDLSRDETVDNAFWFMIKMSLWWFPNEKWFIQIGLEKAKRDNFEAKRVELLNIATVKFFNDLDFLRESFDFRLEQGDGVGANGIVKQMIQQYPESLEPIYYGLKLSLIATGKSSYTHYRSIASEKGMPVYLIQILDWAFYVLKDQEKESNMQFKELSRRFKSLSYYLIPLEYLVQIIFSGNTEESKRARLIFIDSLDMYAKKVLKVHT
ncbi:hypothetical protein [Methanogenium organophilum]|uniref:Uncharacterized protein n=1 Tax=Methanogenium organophilum TaxID=2199 RepID=A0A9X9T8C9_METOG|nr:hypothetical protein [Methanogenium organophilum]WAI01032.1 hypothetical protein OU421_11515 [Methanogenium organophilum]